MAVRLDTSVVRATVGPDLFAAAEEYVSSARIQQVADVSGGVQAVVLDRAGTPWLAWVGVIDRELAGTCTCSDAQSGGLCEHALAAALAALRDGFEFSATSSLAMASCGPDRQVGFFAELASQLTHAELIDLVSRHAAFDARLAATLLAMVGQVEDSEDGEAML